jgi:hypothetical protein
LQEYEDRHIEEEDEKLKKEDSYHGYPMFAMADDNPNEKREV